MGDQLQLWDNQWESRRSQGALEPNLPWATVPLWVINFSFVGIISGNLETLNMQKKVSLSFLFHMFIYISISQQINITSNCIQGTVNPLNKGLPKRGQILFGDSTLVGVHQRLGGFLNQVTYENDNYSMYWTPCWF